MRLDELLVLCPELRAIRAGRRAGDGAASQGHPALSTNGSVQAPLEIRGLTDDSRRVQPGWIFVARQGTRSDGGSFVGEAVARGAVAVVVDAEQTAAAMPEGCWVLLAPPGQAGLAGARLAECLHGRPSRALDLVGVTGTNGKTTTCMLIQQLLAAAGIRCGLMGTVVIDDGVERRPADLTTPSAAEISATLARMVTNRCTAAAMECSSHALHQGRTAALRFGTAIFTNLTGDHLDYHGSMEAYAEAKAILFRGLEESATAVMNADVAWSAQMLEGCRARRVACSLRDARADYFAHLERLEPGWTCASIAAPWGTFRLRLPLVGLHNLMNALQAAAAVQSLGIAGAVIEEALSHCKAPPGRLEPVTPADAPFTVLVDYAHTDDALENVLRSLRALLPMGGRLIAVFGCGGDRDRSKRPRMAAVAARLADVVLITSDNPRTEDPVAIVEEILAGIPQHKRANARCIVDRSEAVHVAVAEARPGDVVVIAGKGHEDYQIIGTAKRPFDDRAVALTALQRRSTSRAAEPAPCAASGCGA